MNINTLSEHRCADKCTDYKATGEQCNHCLVSCPEISDNSSYSEFPNSLNFKLSELKQIIAEMTAANDRLILKYMGEKRQDLAAIHGSFNVALAGLIFQLELPQGNTKKHTQLAETELYRQKQKVELLKTEKLATQVELDADRDDLNPSNSTPLNFEEYENRCGYLNLLSRVQGIHEALRILHGNPEDFDFYSVERKYYYHSEKTENLISLQALQNAVCHYFIDVFGGIQAIQYIVGEAPEGATHFNREYLNLNPKNKHMSVWNNGTWIPRPYSFLTYKDITTLSVNLTDLKDVLDHIKYNKVSESAYSISYSHLTKSTEEQIQFFNKQKKIAEDGGDQQEAISFDHQADGAYLLWLRLTKGCRNPSDNERFQVLVGAKA